MIPEWHVLVQEQRIEDMRREAEHHRMVRQALAARRENRIERTNGLTWEQISVRVLSRVLEGAGRQLTRAGLWLENRYCRPQAQLRYSTGDCEC